MNVVATAIVVGLLSCPVVAADHGLVEGSADLQSAGPLAFGPDGVLFVGDSKGAAIFALDTGESDTSKAKVKFAVTGVDKEIAAVLGTTPDDILINDLAVSPQGNVFFSVTRGRGPDGEPVILKTDPTGAFSELSLKKIKFAKAQLPNAPEPGGEGRRNKRAQAITDLAFVDDQLYIAGLSNEEFASNLRSVPFPFRKVSDGTAVEIYHGAHGNFETRSPVRTFVPFNIDEQPHLLAAYTCTPLVKFPISALKEGTKVRGTTIAELGNRNRPLDMIVYERDGDRYLLIANSSRGIMKVPTDTIADQESIETRVARGETSGVGYETIEDWTGVVQLDSLNDEQAVLLVESDAGLTLKSVELP